MVLPPDRRMRCFLNPAGAKEAVLPSNQPLRFRRPPVPSELHHHCFLARAKVAASSPAPLLRLQCDPATLTICSRARRFFGEDLPGYFHRNIKRDTMKVSDPLSPLVVNRGANSSLAAQADLLITMGTSLQVNPVASIPSFVEDNVPRLLFNRELVGDYETGDRNYRDVVELGSCDDTVREFAKMLGWEAELVEAYNSVKNRVEKMSVEGEGGGGGAGGEEVD